jgi:hypothetical protein
VRCRGHAEVIFLTLLINEGHSMQSPLQARNDSDTVQTKTAKTVAQARMFVDSRPAAIAQRKLAEMMDNSPRVLQQRALSDAIHNSPHMLAQRQKRSELVGEAVRLSTGTHRPTQLATPEAQRRAAHATQTINALSAGFNAAKAGHLFDGIPMAGGAPGSAPPQGLHGYRNGALPGNITETNIVGNRNKKHQITWRWTNPVGAANNGTKDSTMFPAFITESRLKTLIALAHPGWAGVAIPVPSYPQETREYIMLGAQPIPFNTHGDTVYPD